jgi:hypothetical protein
VGAAGSNRARAFGGGSGGSGGNITITGGEVTARSEGPLNDSGGGAGLGGGQYGNGGVIYNIGGYCERLRRGTRIRFAVSAGYTRGRWYNHHYGGTVNAYGANPAQLSEVRSIAPARY